MKYTQAALSVCLIIVIGGATARVQADSFTISEGQVETTTQTLDNDNETGVIEAGGQLNVAGVGIGSTANNVTITTSGTISTTGDSAHGIESRGSDATITTSGTISTARTNARGIQSFGKDATITTSGTISTTGGGAHGIQSFGKDATITTSGTISTAGDNASGIQSEGDDATITTSGTISTTRDRANGIQSEGADATITTSGTISTTGDYAHGIRSEGDDATITTSGTISTTGDDGAHGIRSIGDNATITNSGSINVTGANAVGISADGAGNTTTIHNQGLISATGNATTAILGGTGAETLNLYRGSHIIGRIDLAGGNDTVNIYGANPSATLTLDNAETINLLNGVAGIHNGTVATLVDPTGQSVHSAVLATFTGGLHEQIQHRLTQPAPAKIQLATTRLTPGLLVQPRPSQAWGQLFGAHRHRGAEGQALAYDHDYAGLMGGYDTNVQHTRLGVFGGIAQSDIDTERQSISTDTDSLFVGGYAQIHLGPLALTASLLGGYEQHDNHRRVIDNLAGIEIARTDFDSGFLSPALSLATAYTLDQGLTLHPQATLAYSIAWYDAYRETGTTRSNLSIDNRTVHALQSRLQLAARYTLDTSHLELRAGVLARHTYDDDIHATLSGSDFRFTSASDDSVYGGSLGASLRLEIHDRTHLLLGMDYTAMSGDETQAAGRLALEFAL